MLQSLLALAPLLPAPLALDTVVVPDDAFDLSAAIALAQPGDTIVVRTSLPQNGFGPVFVDKSLTIRGEPVCNLELDAFGLLLSGPGDGRLVLQNVEMAYAFTDNDAKPSLSGTGFEEVVLQGCRIVHDNFAGSGLITLTEPAVDLPDVQSLVLLDTELLGSPAGADDCISQLFQYQDGQPGILAPAADVTLVGSTVNGGRGGFLETTVVPCPAQISDWPGKGGAGIVAANVSATDSVVAGGQGAEWQSVTSGLCSIGPAVPCGTHPQAAAFELTGGLTSADAALVALPAALSLSSGGVQTLTLAADPALAGSIYFVAGSFSGSAPGLPLGPFVLPVNPADAYFDYTVLNANGAVLGQTLGALDASGRAEATVTLTPALPATLVGRTATHAFVLADAGLQALAVSNPTTLEILP